MRKITKLGYGIKPAKKPKYRAVVVSKSVGRISNAWSLIKAKFPYQYIGRYTKDNVYDAYHNMLFHDENYYFEVVL